MIPYLVLILIFLPIITGCWIAVAFTRRYLSEQKQIAQAERDKELRRWMREEEVWQARLQQGELAAMEKVKKEVALRPDDVRDPLFSTPWIYDEQRKRHGEWG